LLKKERSSPWGVALRTFAQVGQLGFVVVGGLLVGYGIGYGIDSLTGGRTGRMVGIVLGLLSGLWSAWRLISRTLQDHGGDEDR